MVDGIKITWDGKPVPTQYGDMRVLCDGVVTLADGKQYRINASSTRGYRQPEIVLRYLSDSVRGREVPERSLANIRQAALESWVAILVPLRKALVASVSQ